MKTWHSKLTIWLLLTIMVANGGCFSSIFVLGPMAAETHENKIALRVVHCYLNAKGQVIVEALGGPDTETDCVCDTKRDPIWFEVNYAAAAKSAQNGLVTLPLSTLKAGAPEATKLSREGFVEVPFNEAETSGPTYRESHPFPPGKSKMEIDFFGMDVGKNFPEKIGKDPWFYVSDATPVVHPPFRIEDHYTTHPYAGYIVLLPVAIAADAVTFPIQFLKFIFSGRWPMPVVG